MVALFLDFSSGRHKGEGKPKIKPNGKLSILRAPVLGDVGTRLDLPPPLP